MRYAHRRVVTRASAVLAGAVVVLFWSGGGSVGAEDARALSPSPAPVATAAPPGVSASAWDRMRTAIERDRYGLRREGDAYVATNHRHRLRVTFGTAGVDVRPQSGQGEWRFGLRLAGYGYGNRRERLAAATRVVEGNRIEYRRGALVEWYVNERRGVEQGFTLASPPTGRRAGVSLVVHLTATGTLRPTLGADRNSVEWGDARGTRTLWYRGLVVVDAKGRTLPSRMEVDGPRLRLRVDDDGATYPLMIDPFIELAKLTAGDPKSRGFFGYAVAVSGDTAIVGSWGGGAHFGGAAYVFERHHGGLDAWGQVVKLRAHDARPDDGFGFAVALSGDIALVGAAQNSLLHGLHSGAAYVFARDHGGPGAWGELAQLDAVDGAPFDNFGLGVALSGDTALVGAPGDDDLGASSGSAYVFERNRGGPDAWGQVTKLVALDGAAADRFGQFVALSVDTALVGAWEDDDAAVNSGSAYIFGRHQGGLENWGQVAKLTASDGAAGDNFGMSVAISGDTALVGAPGDDDSGISSGSAYIFNRHRGGPDVWGQAVKLTAGDAASSDGFGRGLAISGDVALVGAYNDDSGSAYVFERHRGGPDAWGQAAKLLAGDGVTGDAFGFALALDGETALVGAPFDSNALSLSGSAYVLGIVEDPILEVTIDIKPGSFPNSINPGAGGVIPVAILTTADFDASSVAPSSAEFGPGGATAMHTASHLEDVDGDGDLDLVLHFRTAATGIACGDDTASLTGETFDGQPIAGADSVRTVPCK